jgi:hypothetical protein
VFFANRERSAKSSEPGVRKHALERDLMGITNAEKKRRQRAKVLPGWCRRCVGKRKALVGKKVCAICSRAIALSVYRRRGHAVEAISSAEDSGT